MVGEHLSQRGWRALVEKDPHDHSRKLVETCPGLEILEQGLDEHAGSLEQPSPADLPWLPFDGRAQAPVQHHPSVAQPR
jgi:hypothetical protein